MRFSFLPFFLPLSLSLLFLFFFFYAPHIALRNTWKEVHQYFASVTCASSRVSRIFALLSCISSPVVARAAKNSVQLSNLHLARLRFNTYHAVIVFFRVAGSATPIAVALGKKISNICSYDRIMKEVIVETIFVVNATMVTVIATLCAHYCCCFSR